MKVELASISKGVQDQFEIELLSGQALKSTEVFRRVPDRRIVCKGEWQEKNVFAKIFIGEDALRYLRREAEGFARVLNANLLAPAVLYQGANKDGSAQVIVFEAIEHCQNADDALNAADRPGRLILAKALVKAVAKQHDAGLIQTDMYPKNFLVQGEDIYTIDGDAIKPLGGFFSGWRALNNLAMLLSKFDVLDMEEWLPDLVAEYQQHRSCRFNITQARLLRSIHKNRYCVVHGYADKKVFRQCTDVAVKKTWTKFMAISRQYDEVSVRQALAVPDMLLDQSVHQRLKSGNTCTVSLTEVDGRKVVIKRYNIKNFWHGLSRALRISRAAKSWASAYRLRMLGIATAQPMALLEKRIGVIRRQAYFLAEYIEAPNAVEFFSDKAVSDGQRAETAKNIAKLFYRLNLLKIAHGDFKATNIKVLNENPWLIDLDSMRQYRCNWLFARQHLRDIRRFMRNWQHDAAISNLLVTAFAEQYKNTALLKQAKILMK